MSALEMPPTMAGTTDKSRRKVAAEADGAKNEGRSRMGSARRSLGVVECRMAVPSPLGTLLRTRVWHKVPSAGTQLGSNTRYQPLTVSNRGT